MLIVDKERNGENSTLSVHLFRYILFSTAFDSLKNKTSNLTFFLETLRRAASQRRGYHGAIVRAHCVRRRRQGGLPEQATGPSGRTFRNDRVSRRRREPEER